MLPSRICDACREGRTDDVISWLTKNKTNKSWKDDIHDKWIMFPVIVNAIESNHTKIGLHEQRVWMCLYLFGFHKHDFQLIQRMINQLERQCTIQQSHASFFGNFFSWVICGAAEAGNFDMVKRLSSENWFNAFDVLIGGCRGNHATIVDHFENEYYNGGELSISCLFGASQQSIRLFKQYTNSNPLLFALLTRDFQQAHEEFKQLSVSDKFRMFGHCMCRVADIGDVETMDNLLHTFDETATKFYIRSHKYHRQYVLEKCAVRIVTYGHQYALDWIMPLISQTTLKTCEYILFDEAIYYGHADLVVKLNRGNKIVLQSNLIATYLNYGGQVQNRYHVDDFRQKKQHLVSSCLSLVLLDKRMIKCVILNTISFE